MRKLVVVVLSLLVVCFALAGERRQAAPPAETNAAKTFEITARQWEFIINPAQFVVNQGDSVTLRITVPADDGSSSGHGFALEHYSEEALLVARGRTQEIRFTATTPGTFTYFCTNASCGLPGHTTMNGTFTVLAAAPAPTIASIAPASGPAAGGTAVTITGTNFANGATVRFGSMAATTTTLSGSTSIVAVAPAQAPGKVVVSVTNPDGAQATFDGFAYTGPTPPRRRSARS